MDFPTPVLLGADLNCYQLARLMHRDYGVTSYAFGRYPLGETKHSRIVRFREIPDLWNEKTALDLLRDFASSHPRCLLFGCTDQYVSLIVSHRAELEPHYLIPYGDKDFYQLASDKLAFAHALEPHGIPTPRTWILTEETPLCTLPFPIVLKAACSAKYYAHPFAGMKKAYLVQDAAAATSLLRQIRAAGYFGDLLLQDYIPGDDTAMYVANGYVDRDGNLRQLAVGHVLLQEHTPNGIGNPAAILTKRFPQIEALVTKIVSVLPVRGLFNLDIRYDRRDGSYRILECNPRQGRSAFSTDISGLSPIAAAIEELVFQKPFHRTCFPVREGYWHSVPTRLVTAHLPPALQAGVQRCISQAYAADTLAYPYDLRRNLRRQLYRFLHNLSHIRKFHVYDSIRSTEL